MLVHIIQKAGLFSEIRKVIQKELRVKTFKNWECWECWECLKSTFSQKVMLYIVEKEILKETALPLGSESYNKYFGWCEEFSPPVRTGACEVVAYIGENDILKKTTSPFEIGCGNRYFGPASGLRLFSSGRLQASSSLLRNNFYQNEQGTCMLFCYIKSLCWHIKGNKGGLLPI